jgi:hypothetical protein
VNGPPEAFENSNAVSSEIAEPLPPAPRGTKRFFEGVDWLCFGMTAGAAFCVYLWTLAPSVTLELSGIYCVGAMYAGVPHPPGYPLWTIYAWLFTVLLPISNIAWRVAVSSAVAGALTCGLIGLMTSRGGGLIGEGFPQTLRPKQAAALRVVGGYVAGMAFGFDGAFWRTAVVVNTWPFSLLLFSIALCFLMKWFFMPERKRVLYLACLSYGMSVSNSQALLVAGLGLQLLITSARQALGRDMLFANCILGLAGFLSNGFGLSPIFEDDESRWMIRIQYLLSSPQHWIPTGLVILSFTFCIVLIARTRSFLTEWKKVLISGAMFFAGLAAYLYVPLASMTDPPVNWGYPRTVTGFIHVLSRGQYERIQPTQSVARLVEATRLYVEIALKEFGGVYLLLALMPFCFLPRIQARERRWILGLLAVYLCLTVIMLVGMNPSTDRQSVEMNKVFFSASHIVLAIWVGFGVMILGITAFGRSEPAVRLR